MQNSFKRRLKTDEKLIGLWSSLCSPIVTEALSFTEFDWIVLDSEHAPLEVADLLPLLQAMQAGRVDPIVRVSWNDAVLIKRALDLGAQTLLIPFIETAQEAHAAISATRYPPEGIRGVAGGTRASRYGLEPNYLQKANSEICVVLQIESRKGLENIETIAAVEGVDGIFIGPSDLSASLGHLGDPNHPEVQTQLEQIATTLNRLKIPAGILAFNTEDAKRYLDWGYRFVAVGSDLDLLMQAAKSLKQQF